MMKFMRKSKGYISIFLCLVMLPMVTFASMVIDVSRLQSAKSFLTSAGDLTMNAGLSEYEKTLQDMYGLFATVKNEAELQTALEAYFTKTISSTIGTGSKSEEEYVQNMASDIATAILSTSDYSTIDFTNLVELQMDDASDSFTYSGVKNSALANPAVMKQQIVDYMKYKGPISIASTLLSKLKFLKDSSNQTTAVQKKVEYTKTLSDLQNPCEEAYAKIIGTYEEDKKDDTGYNDYVKVYNDCVKVGDYTTRLNKMEEHFNYVSQYIYYYYQAKSLKDMVGEFTYAKMKEETIEIEGSIEDYSSYGTVTRENLAALKTEFTKLVDYFGTKKGIVEQYFGNIKVGFSDEGYIDINGISFTDQPKDYPYACWDNMVGKTDNWEDTFALPTSEYGSLTKISQDSQYEKRYDLQIDLLRNVELLSRFVRYYEQLKALDTKLQDAWNDYEEYVYDEAENTFIEEHKDDSDTDTESLKNAAIAEALLSPEVVEYRKVAELSKEIVTRLKDDYLPKYEGILSSLNNIDCYKTVAESSLTMALDEVDEFYTSVCNCESQAKAVSESLGDVLESIENVEAARTEWGGAIDNVQDDTMKTTFKSDFDSMTNGIEEDDVVNLQTVANNCESYFGSIREKIESIKFFDVQVFYGQTDFNILDASEDEFEKYFKQDDYKKTFAIDDMDTTAEVMDAAKTLNDTKLVDDVARNATFSVGNKLDGKEVPTDFTKEPTKDDDNEKFFYTLKSICNPKEASDDKSSVDYVQKVQEGADKESVDYTKDSEGNSKTSGDDDAEEESSDSDFDFDAVMAQINTYTENLASTDEGIDSKDGTNTKDINVSSDNDDYSGNADNASDSLGAAASVLQVFTDLADTAVEKAYLEEYFTEMFTCQTDVLNDKTKANKLLNGKAIGDLKQGNEWYGYEMEYLIWGDSNMGANRVKNEAMIFTIRFALNTIYAFTASDIQTFALQTATAIGGWCVIGVPIIQACITVALAMAESAYDLCRLKAGEDIPIYKNSANFVCSPTGFMKTAITEITTDVIEKVSNDLGEKINETIDVISEKADAKIEDCMSDVNKLVEDYIKQQEQNLTSLITNHFTTPIINKITPVISLADNAVTTVEDSLDTALDEAFAVIETNINNEGEGAIKELSSLVFYNFIDKEGLKDTLLGKISSGTFSAEAISNVVNEKVESWVTQVGTKISTKANDLGTELKNAILEKKDEAASNIKSIVGDKIDDLSTQLTNKATEAIAGKLKDGALNMTDVGAAGGITLNYKEYCKIFMLINVMADENKVLKRCAALIQANVCNAKEGANPDFKIIEANTLVSINAKVKMGTLFPWAVSVSDDTATGTSSVELDLSSLGSNYVTIEYSGVNGY